MKKWETLSRETLFETPYYSFDHHRYRMPSGKDGDYYFLNTPGAVMIIPIDKDGRPVLVRQYRYLLGEDSIEFPAGGVPSGADPLDQAKKELAEETGYSAEEWEYLGRFASWNGATNEICRVYLARELHPVNGEQDESEEIETLSLTWSELNSRIAGNEIFDGMTLASFALARNRLRAAPGIMDVADHPGG